MRAHELLSPEDLSDIYVLERIKGFGPQKFKELNEAGMSPHDLLRHPREFQRFGKRGIDFRKQAESAGSAGRQAALARAIKQIESARQSGGAILTYESPQYPDILYRSNLPVAALYVRGDISVLGSDLSVACVGSRKIRSPYTKFHDKFASKAVELGFAIVSGFATGADIIGHLAAERSNGRTVCVMPSGLDRPFPPEHKEIWRRFLDLPGVVFVSEFGFGVGANALNLRKRNKMIAGMARGVLVSQSTEEGGAMNAYRFAIEQKKPVATFRSDGSKDTSGNELIAGSAEHVRATVLDGPDTWAPWLRAL